MKQYNNHSTITYGDACPPEWNEGAQVVKEEILHSAKATFRMTTTITTTTMMITTNKQINR